MDALQHDNTTLRKIVAWQTKNNASRQALSMQSRLNLQV